MKELTVKAIKDKTWLDDVFKKKGILKVSHLKLRY